MRAALFCFAISLVFHAVWAFTIPFPVDWDPAYYSEVARNIAAGEGATTRALIFLGYTPASLPMSADLHWMPLPSRVLVPGVLLWEHGAQMTTVVLAALWAPLAVALARQLRVGSRVELGAGLLAALGGGYVRFLSTPDSIALYGVIGGAALWAVASERWRLFGLMALLAALCRGDGLLLGPLLALPLLLRGRAAGLMGLLGPVGWVAWQMRNDRLGGDLWLASRAGLSSTLDYASFVLGAVGAPTVQERVHFAGEQLLQGLVIALMMGVMILPWPGLMGAWRHRSHRAVQASLSFALLMPIAVLILAPAVAASGSIFRSGAALFPMGCVLAASGIERLSHLAVSYRGYPRLLIPGLLGGGYVIGTIALGWMNVQLRPSSALDCRVLALQTAPILATDPSAVALQCRHPAVLIPPSDPADLVERFGIEAAWIHPDRAGGIAGGPPKGWALEDGVHVRPEPD